MSYYDDELNPVDIEDISMESLLEYLALDNVRLNIEQQLTGRLSANKNFVEATLDKFEMIRKNKSDPEEVNQIVNELVEFCGDLISRICNRYHLGVNPNTDDSLEYIEILKTVYTFFVTGRDEYVKDFFVQYILQNKTEIVRMMGISASGTDITTRAYKSKDVDADGIAILSKINDVINYVRNSLDISVEEFLTVIDDGDYYVNMMRDYFGMQILVGDFVAQYINDVLDEYSSESALKIRNDIRIALSNTALGE